MWGQGHEPAADASGRGSDARVWPPASCCCGHKTGGHRAREDRVAPVDPASVGAVPAGRGWGSLPARCSSSESQKLAAGRGLVQEERQLG